MNYNINIGDVYNNLRVVKEILGKRTSKWECVCDCGNTTIVKSWDLVHGHKKSCGCNKQHLAEDLTGQRFGSLTVIQRADVSDKNYATRSAFWECSCDCGNTTVKSALNLKKETHPSCGCHRTNILVDRIGNRYGKLTVIAYDGTYKGNCAKWLCRCDCGTVKSISGSSLQSGKTKSCGCLVYEVNQELIDSKRKRNSYIICDNYVIMYTPKNEPFFVSIEDFGKIYKYTWSKNGGGYLCSRIHNKNTLLHRFIMNCPDGLYVDHIGGSDTVHDNRRENLRIVSQLENMKNHKTPITNSSGCCGVTLNAKGNRWVARIVANGKQINLGTYDTYEEAVLVRKAAEDQYYGEFSRSSSLNLLDSRLGI